MALDPVQPQLPDEIKALTPQAGGSENWLPLSVVHGNLFLLRAKANFPMTI